MSNKVLNTIVERFEHAKYIESQLILDEGSENVVNYKNFNCKEPNAGWHVNSLHTKFLIISSILENGCFYEINEPIKTLVGNYRFAPEEYRPYENFMEFLPYINCAFGFRNITNNNDFFTFQYYDNDNKLLAFANPEHGINTHYLIFDFESILKSLYMCKSNPDTKEVVILPCGIKIK